MDVVFEAYLQTHNNLDIYYGDIPEDDCDEALKYFADNKDNIQFDMWHFGVCNPKFEIISADSIKYKDTVITNLMGYLETKYPILKISIKVDILKYIDEIMLDKFNALVEEDVVVTAEDINMTLVNIIFEKRINEIVVAANLAKPGCLRITKGAVVRDGKYIELVDCQNSSNLSNAVGHCNKIGYPVFQELDFITAWNWINNFDNYKLGFSINKIERALNCFTFLLEKSQPESLFYSIMGIEALYVEGNGGLQEQVKSKSEAFLGKQNTFKKAYSSMYDFRSRYIHGDLNFPLSHWYDTPLKKDNFNINLEEATYFSTGLLIASLQKLCVLNKNDLNFEIKVCD